MNSRCWYLAAVVGLLLAIQMDAYAASAFRCVAEFQGFENHIYSVFSSSDSSQVMASGAGGVWVWDRSSEKLFHHLAPNGATSAALAPDDNVFLVGMGYGKLEKWSNRTGDRILEVDILDGNVTAIAFASDQSYFLVGSGFKIREGMVLGSAYKIHLYDGQNLKRKSNFTGHIAPVRSIHVVANRTRFISASDDGTLRMWNVNPAEEIKIAGTAIPPDTTEWQGKDIIQPRDFRNRASLSVSQDDKLLIWNSKVWDIENWQEIKQLVPASKSERVICSAFSFDKERFATGHTDGTVRLWNTATLEEVGRFYGHLNKAATLAVAFSPDGRFLLTGGEGCISGFESINSGRQTCDLTVRLWKIPEARESPQAE